MFPRPSCSFLGAEAAVLPTLDSVSLQNLANPAIFVKNFVNMFSIVSLQVYFPTYRTRAYFERRGVLSLIAKWTDWHTNVPPAKNSW